MAALALLCTPCATRYLAAPGDSIGRVVHVVHAVAVLVGADA